jgi:hypothetical protein
MESNMLITREHRLAAMAGSPASQFVFTAALASIPFVLALALFLAARRAMGAMSAPLGPLPLLATALMLLGWVWLVRATVRGLTQGVPGRPANFKWSAEFWVVVGTWAALLLVAFACSFPGGRFVDWLIWLPSITAAWVGPNKVTDFFRKQARRSPTKKSSNHASVSTEDRVLQRVTRFLSDDGRASLYGELHAELAAGERDATLFVAFCPPFQRLPQVEAHLTDDIVADVTLTQVLHNGAQLDVRLPRPAAGATSIALELLAVEPERP